MSAVEADPVGVIIPRFVARFVGFGESQPAMHFRLYVVISFTVPRMTFGNAHIAASVAEAVVNDHPLIPGMFTFR